MTEGRIVAHAVSPHTPRMANPDTTPDFLAGVMAGAREMGEVIRSYEPDLWVVHSTHWVTTFDWYITHQAQHDGLCVGEECPDLIPGIEYSIQGDPEFAAALSAAIEGAGFPGGQSRTPNHRFDYGSYVPLVYLDPEFSLPVVLLGCCVMAGIGECMAVGAAVAQAAQASGRSGEHGAVAPACAWTGPLAIGRRTKARPRIHRSIMFRADRTGSASVFGLCPGCNR